MALENAAELVPQELHGLTPIRYYGDPDRPRDFDLQYWKELVEKSPFNKTDLSTMMSVYSRGYHIGKTFH